jgi:RNA polymerase sigma-54 factor
MKLLQKQEQRQILSPQILQTFHILQFPLMELREFIEKKLEENPLLEETYEENKDEIDEDNYPEENLEKNYNEDVYQNLIEKDLSLPDPDDFNKYIDYKINSLTYTQTLESYLEEQLGILNLNEKEKEIGEFVIGNLDENGYLNVSISEIAKTLNTEEGQVEKILKIIQEFDPPGIAARDLKECLIIQLKLKNKLDPIIKEIIENYFDDIAYRKYNEIARKLSISVSKVKRYVEEIKKLDPKPARNYRKQDLNFPIIPDIILHKLNGRYSILINEEEIPHIRLKEEYLNLLKKNSLTPEAKLYLKEQYKNGKMLIKAIEQRKNTLMKVITELITIQADFFKYGYEALKPLRLDDLAQRLGVNESTISRVIANKYIMTPNGIFPLKKLFDYKVYYNKTEVQTAERIKRRIQEIVESESSKKTLSDSKIAEVLKQEGINVARRTIAKYRKQLKILPKGLRVER